MFISNVATYAVCELKAEQQYSERFAIWKRPANIVIAIGADNPPRYINEIIGRIGDVKTFISWTIWDVQVFIREMGQLAT